MDLKVVNQLGRPSLSDHIDRTVPRACFINEFGLKLDSLLEAAALLNFCMGKRRFELLTDAQWEWIGPLMPEPKRRKDRRGRPRASNRA